MKRTNAELKQMARASLKGKWGIAIGITVLYLIIAVAMSMLSQPFIAQDNGYFMAVGLIITFIVTLITLVFAAGIQLFFLNMARGQEYKVSNLFAAFKMHPDRFIVAGLLMMLISIVLMLPTILFAFVPLLGLGKMVALALIIVWSIVASVLLVIISLRFALYNMLLLDNPDMGAIQSLRVSGQYMKGNKGRFFYMQLSFIGWSLLGLLSCYIGLLWVVPYMSATQAFFYLDVIGEPDRQPSAPYETQGQF